MEACADAGLLSTADDCDDADATVHPEAEETCDGVDQDCDGDIDEGVLITVYADLDGDGYGDPASPFEACDGLTDDADRDDADATIHPEAEDPCDDGVDADCDGEDASVTTYVDGDGDGHGDPTTGTLACGDTAAVTTGDDGDDGVFAPGYDGGRSNVGALFVYGGGTTFSTSTVAVVAGTASNSDLGWDCLADDFDEDGAGDLLAGAQGGAGGAGYLFYGPLAGTVSASDADAVFTGATAGLLGGGVPTRPGDVTGDGFPDVALGAPNDSTSYAQGGALYIWPGPGGP